MASFVRYILSCRKFKESTLIRVRTLLEIYVQKMLKREKSEICIRRVPPQVIYYVYCVPCSRRTIIVITRRVQQLKLENKNRKQIKNKTTAATDRRCYRSRNEIIHAAS